MHIRSIKKKIAPTKIKIDNGDIFGWLVVVDDTLIIYKTKNCVKVRCKCGVEKYVIANNLQFGLTKSCGCFKKSKEYSLMKTKNINDTQVSRLYLVYNKSAQFRKLNFSLSKEEFKSFLFKPCYYCNSPPLKRFKLQAKHNKREIMYNGIDRVNNDKGYELNNCVTCCYICNRIKSNFKVEDFKSWLDNLAVNYLKNNPNKKLPTRLETGVIKEITDSFPALFIRGSDCLVFSNALEKILNESNIENTAILSDCKEILDLLKSADITSEYFDAKNIQKVEKMQ